MDEEEYGRGEIYVNTNNGWNLEEWNTFLWPMRRQREEKGKKTEGMEGERKEYTAKNATVEICRKTEY